MMYQVFYANNTEGLSIPEIWDKLESVTVEYDEVLDVDEYGTIDAFTDDAMPILDLAANEVGNMDWVEYICRQDT